MTPPIIIQDFLKICRCCMEVATYDIFKTYFENEPLSKLLLICSNLRIPRNDNLPKNICQSCLQQLISAYIFNQKVAKTQTAISEISKVLERAKAKKGGNVSSDHDYHNGKKNKKSLEQDSGDDQNSATALASVKIEMDNPDDEDYNGETGQPMDVSEARYFKQHDQRFWLEEGGESVDSEGNPIGTYGAIGNIFDAVNELNPLDFQAEDSNATEEAQMITKVKRKKPLQSCTVCKESFATTVDLNAHARESNHPQKFCSTCNEYFYSYSALIRHCMDTKHPRPDIFKCPYCFKKFVNKKILNQHMKGHLMTKTIHVTKDREGNFFCQVCRTKLANLDELRFHYKNNPETHLTCNLCFRKYGQLEKLQKHLRLHSSEKPLECPTCGLRFHDQTNLERHMLSHELHVKVYECQLCPRAFTDEQMLFQHEKQHENATSYVCTECGKIFASGGFLKKHVERYHLGLADQKNQQGPHECDLCGKLLSCKATLYSHMRNVHEKTQKLFPCVICGKVLKTKTSLELHVNYHTGNCPFKCDVCGKAFTNATTLKSHSLIHTDERPYVCHICNKTFKQKPHLNTHILTIHTGIKPFSCSYCDKTFALNGNLSQHMKTHTGCESPYVCSICNKAFYFASRLRKHEKIHLKYNA